MTYTKRKVSTGFAKPSVEEDIMNAFNVRTIITGTLLALATTTSVGCATASKDPVDQAKLAKAERYIERHESKAMNITSP